MKHGFTADEVIRMVIIKAMGVDEEETLLKGITANMKASAEKDATGKKAEPKPIPEEAEYEEKMAEADDMPYEEIEDDDVEPFQW